MNDADAKMSLGVVMLADALGTKGIWQREPVPAIINRWRVLADDIHEAEKQLSRQSTARDWRLQTFSDTIIISCYASDQLDAILDMTRIAMRLIGGGLSIGIQLRGAIATGLLCRSDDILIGPAIDEAASEYEQTDWIGIHLSASAEEFVRKQIDCDWKDFQLLAPWQIPFKSKPRLGYAVGWPLAFDLPSWGSSGPFSGDSRERLLSCLKDLNRTESLKQKLDETLAYFDAYANHPRS